MGETGARRYREAVRAALIGVLLTSAACHREPTKAQQQAEDARAIAAVEAVQDSKPPIEAVTPETIGRPEMERFGLLGSGCAFVPGSARGGDPIAVAGPNRATVKLNGRMKTFGSDTGSKSLPAGAWSHYVGKELSMTIEQIAAPGAIPETGPARFTVKDRFDRVVHAEDGTLTCGS